MFMIIALGFVIGACLGSLSLCLATRALKHKSFWGRSYCLDCKQNLHWYDLFPVLSYIFLRGKCRYCSKPLSREYILVELIMGGLVAYLFFQQFTPNVIQALASVHDLASWPNTFLPAFLLSLVFKLFVLSILAAVFITDIKAGLIPDELTLPAALITVIYQVLIIVINIGLMTWGLAQSVLGKYLLPPHTNYIWVHSWVFMQPFLWTLLTTLIITLFFGGLIFITRGRGMGGGDLKLGVFLGLALGFPNAILALLLAFFLGSLVGTGLILIRKKHFGQTIPFGPFLALGSLCALFWGEKIIAWYISIN